MSVGFRRRLFQQKGLHRPGVDVGEDGIEPVAVTATLSPVEKADTHHVFVWKSAHAAWTTAVLPASFIRPPSRTSSSKACMSSGAMPNWARRLATFSSLSNGPTAACLIIL